MNQFRWFQKTNKNKKHKHFKSSLRLGLFWKGKEQHLQLLKAEYGEWREANKLLKAYTDKAFQAWIVEKYIPAAMVGVKLQVVPLNKAYDTAMEKEFRQQRDEIKGWEDKQKLRIEMLQAEVRKWTIDPNHRDQQDNLEALRAKVRDQQLWLDRQQETIERMIKEVRNRDDKTTKTEENRAATSH